MTQRLEGIKRSYQALTERLADPDVIADSNLLMKVMSDRSKSENVVNTYDEVSTLSLSLHLFVDMTVGEEKEQFFCVSLFATYFSSH